LFPCLNFIAAYPYYPFVVHPGAIYAPAQFVPLVPHPPVPKEQKEVEFQPNADLQSAKLMHQDSQWKGEYSCLYATMNMPIVSFDSQLGCPPLTVGQDPMKGILEIKISTFGTIAKYNREGHLVRIYLKEHYGKDIVYHLSSLQLPGEKVNSANVLVSLPPELFDIRFLDIGQHNHLIIITVPFKKYVS
jgi:hypothetical protein